MGQDRDIKMNFGKMVDFNKLIDLVANQEKKKSTITSNIVINQSVNGTDDVLKAAKANQELIASLGGLKKEETAKFFELQKHYFKDLIAKKMKMRFIPNLTFKLDTSFEYSERIEALLKNDKFKH